MSIPWPSEKTFAHLHADCFMLWEREARAALAQPLRSDCLSVSHAARCVAAPRVLILVVRTSIGSLS